MSEVGNISWIGTFLAIGEFLKPIYIVYHTTLMELSSENPKSKVFDFLEWYCQKQSEFSEENKVKENELYLIKESLNLEFQSKESVIFCENAEVALEFDECKSKFTKRTDFMNEKAIEYISKFV